MTGWALNFSAGKLLVTLQVLLAVGTGKFEFAHKFRAFGWCKAWPKVLQDAIPLLRRLLRSCRTARAHPRTSIIQHRTSNPGPKCSRRASRFAVRSGRIIGPHSVLGHCIRAPTRPNQSGAVSTIGCESECFLAIRNYASSGGRWPSHRASRRHLRTENGYRRKGG